MRRQTEKSSVSSDDLLDPLQRANTVAYSIFSDRGQLAVSSVKRLTRFCAAC